tara:strand:- start:813 stop:1028 length:216 start_codon:yes stop_codon:yes gene_type:complete
MTKEQIKEIGQWLMEENIANYYEPNNQIYIESECQIDELDCILSDLGIEYTIVEHEYTIQLGDYLAHIILK